MGNFHFRNKEDAERHQQRSGGTIHDNRHSAHEWNDNQFTVQTNPTGQPELAHYNEEVPMTRKEHEAWMEAKGWSESIKEMHRKAFTGLLEFDDCGSFEYI